MAGTKLELNPEEVALVCKGLMEMPFKLAAPVLAKIQLQTGKQKEEPLPEKS